MAHRSILEIKGIGAARAAVLKEETQIETIRDLFYYFPRRYVDRTIADSTLLREGADTTLIVTVQSSYVAHGRKSRLIVHCKTLKGESLHLVWFRGVPYFRGLFKKDDCLVVSGKLEYFGGMQMAHPDFEHMDEDDRSALLHVGRIVPIYPSGEALKRKALDSRGFRRIVAAAFESDLTINEIIPEEILAKRKLAPRKDALRNIHFPENAASLEEARRRLKYEELYLFNVMMRKKKDIRESQKRTALPAAIGHSKEYENFLNRLPYKLTSDQDRAIQEILSESQKKHASAILLQGDVGSGKTAVAVGVALHYLEKGFQVAMLAPTELLARQHYRTIVDMIGLSPSIHTGLLTGQDSKKGREAVADAIKSGDMNFVAGTHSLIEESVAFKNLGLAIIDEQHRFGVEQRDALRKKAENPDIVAMTATPIPRTLCLTEFADLTLVTLKEKPAGRKPIKTMWFREDRRDGVYKSIRKHVSAGRQCYIVYPVIDESEKKDLKAATEGFEELKTKIFPDLTIELIHGRLKAPDREKIMNEFRAGRTQILVSTTVIEVGVDVPNACIMLIEHADRFGISQLHQLRGRVGRGEHESFCVLMTGEVTEDAVERLTALEKSEDGFYLAEVDMKIRGPGQLLGFKQHGMPGFRLADLSADREMVQESFQDAGEFFRINEEAIEIIRSHFPEGAVIFPA